MIPDYLSGERLYGDVAFYAHLGEHRTATPVDRRTTDWIAERLALAGMEASVLPWSVRQFSVEACELRVAGEEVEAFPYWFPRATGATPLAAPLARFAADGRAAVPQGAIAVAETGNAHAGGGLADGDALVRVAAAAGAAALVLITDSPSRELVAYNQPRLAPQPIPVVLVGARDRAHLLAAAAVGAPGAVLVAGRDDPQARTGNAVGRYAAGRKTIVISTPSSGWFQCAGERGPGIALLLALARWVGERRPATSYVFTANAGHELGNLGMTQCLESGVVAPDDVVCWLHLGASIGTVGWYAGRQSPRLRTLGGAADMVPLLADAFAALPQLEPIEAPVGGETPLVRAAGYRRLAGLAGHHPRFHTRADHAETSVDPALLEAIGRALTSLLETVERLDLP